MLTLYSADFIGNPGNCSYPHKTIVMDVDSLKAAVGHDYVCAEYKNHYRNNDNFLSADCLPVDCDNDHSEDSKDWVTPADTFLVAVYGFIIYNVGKIILYLIRYAVYHIRRDINKYKSNKDKQ